MWCMSDISDQITTDAAKLASSTNDGVTTSRRSLTELIEADKYTRAIDAATSPAATFRAMNCKIVAPGGR